MVNSQETGIIGEDETEGDPDLGDSVHPKTIEAYKKLGRQVPDSIRLATNRPQEKMKRRIKEIKGNDPEETFKIITLTRMKNRAKKEFYAYVCHTTIKNMQGNTTRPNEYTRGTHIEPQGEAVRDLNWEITRYEENKKKQIFDFPWDVKQIKKLIERHEKSGNLPEDIQLLVGEASSSTRSVFQGRTYSIMNLQDFLEGSYEDLIRLGQRGLSGFEPSLGLLSQPIDQDPEHSLVKQGKIR